MNQVANRTVSKNNTVIFWHIYYTQLKHQRCVDIINRQYNKLQNSGLIDNCLHVYIGYVGEDDFPLPEILKNKKIEIFSHSPKGFEEITTNALKSWADKWDDDDTIVLYIHNRGVSGLPDSPTDDWTLMMEFFVIEQYIESIKHLENHYTAGCELWHHPHRINNNDFIYHYSGNFWWARVEYIKMLKYPNTFNRHTVGEDWILELAGKSIDINNFYVLHRTSIRKYERGVVHSYIDRYPRKNYETGSETPSIELDLSSFHGTIV